MRALEAKFRGRAALQFPGFMVHADEPFIRFALLHVTYV